MDSIDFFRLAALCLLLAGVETLHGIARTVWLSPRIGKERAIKLSAATGTLLAFAICYRWVPDIGAVGAGAHLILGLALSGFMATFDVATAALDAEKNNIAVASLVAVDRKRLLQSPKAGPASYCCSR